METTQSAQPAAIEDFRMATFSKGESIFAGLFGGIGFLVVLASLAYVGFMVALWLAFTMSW